MMIKLKDSCETIGALPFCGIASSTEHAEYTELRASTKFHEILCIPCSRSITVVWSEVSPIGSFPVGASFLIVGTTKGLVLIESKTLSIFRGGFFKEELFSILN